MFCWFKSAKRDLLVLQSEKYFARVAILFAQGIQYSQAIRIRAGYKLRCFYKEPDLEATCTGLII